MNNAEEWINDMKDRIMEITQSEQQTKKSNEKNESKIRDLWETIKCANLHTRCVTECSVPPHQVRLIWCTGWSLDLLSVQVLCARSQSPGEIQELAAGMRAEAGPMSYSHILVSFLFYLFFINYKAILSLLSNAVLVSAVQKCESAICIHISPSSWASLPLPRPHSTPPRHHRELS